MLKRRQWLQGLMVLAALPSLGRAEALVAKASKPLRILFLGGTGFLGPQQVEYALARGHRVTLFNRGKNAPGLYGDRVEVLLGDRDGKVGAGLSALQGRRRWDVVIDNSGYIPRHVRDSVELLGDRVGRYLFVSTVAVYERSAGAVFDESSKLRPAPVPETEIVTDETYGPLKAECDRIVQATLGPRATIVRPTYIFGPGDDTDRFTYWLDRVARGGEVLVPPDPQVELQWVDVRDLCPWIVDLTERDQAGIFNAAGPAKPVTWGLVLRQLTQLSPRPVRFTPATAEVLLETGISLPLVRASNLRGGGSVHFASSAAQAAGLEYRPLAETAAATLAWWRAQPAERRAQAEGWPTAAQEAQALRLLQRQPA